MRYSELKDRDVLVTGAKGFVGSHLVDKLVNEEANVTAFVRASTTGYYRNLEQSRDEINIIRGDLQDPTSVGEAISKLSGGFKPTIFHLGAQSHVGQSWQRPRETIRTNVIGTLNILEEVRRQEIDIDKINIAGTSEEYGNIDKSRISHYKKSEDAWMLNEKSPLNPESIYGTSKIAADCLASNYSDAYNIPALTTRMFNNFGPRQGPNFITGTIITQALSRDFIEVGNLQPKRDMMYIDDGVRGHIEATLEGSSGERYNFGSGESVSIENWVKKVLKIGREEGYWDKREVVQKDERFRPGDSEVQELKADYSKLNNLSGWSPETSKRVGIERTIKWYKQNEDKWQDLCDWR